MILAAPPTLTADSDGVCGEYARWMDCSASLLLINRVEPRRHQVASGFERTCPTRPSCQARVFADHICTHSEDKVAPSRPDSFLLGRAFCTDRFARADGFLHLSLSVGLHPAADDTCRTL